MNPTTATLLLFVLIPSLAVAQEGPQPNAPPYAGWRHSGEMIILTTPEGADLGKGIVIEDFPLLVRLHKDWFDFSQAAAGGVDVRFSSHAGAPLAFQVEQWDTAKSEASIWVRIPRIEGQSRQAIRMHWGNPDAADESNGKAVFNESNGYVSVWHMGDAVRDEVGTLDSKDVGTTATEGIVGKARHLAGGQGVFGGDKIANYPSADGSHSTEAWFRAERPNATIIGWGNEGGGRGSKVRMILRSPPHLRVDSDFSDVKGEGRLPMNEWVHVVHTFGDGPRRIYINGKLDGEATTKLDIKSPARLWLGGWYHNYDFVGDLDEVRVSRVARTADWVRLQFENQKPMQTLVGHLVQSGDASTVSPAKLTVAEGQLATVTAKAGGAQRVYWVLKRDGDETVVATDRFNFTFDAGRVSGDQSVTLQFKAVYAGGVKALDIPVAIKEAIPDPEFTLKAPATWDGRAAIDVAPKVSNLKEMEARNASNLKCTWTVSDIAVTKEVVPDSVTMIHETDRDRAFGRDRIIPHWITGKLRLTRAQNSGRLIVTATVSNGGRPVIQTVEIAVTEPATDPWVARTPGADEKPMDNQFYARDDRNEGTLYYNGTLDQPVDSVFLKLYADGQLVKTETGKPGANNAYGMSVKLKPGLTKYRVEFGTKTGDTETVVNTVNNIVCGDAYLIDGQSNAVATDWGQDKYDFTSTWIRTFGSTEGGPQVSQFKRWGDAVARGEGGKFNVGCWAMELGRRLVEHQKMPICFINGAVGGTRIDQHQRTYSMEDNAKRAVRDDTDGRHHEQVEPDLSTIYGRLLWRVREARLTHGIRGVFWHQGENDQGADGPTGGFGYETYRQYFLEMAAAWKQDYPNIQHYYVFQIWPKSCSMGIDGSDNRLREVQRNLPTAFSRMSIMSTLGIDPPGGCHYPPAGYAEIARLICPLVQRDHYGVVPAASVTPPNLARAYYTGDKKDEVVMQFDQPVRWDDALVGQFYLDGLNGAVASGRADGNLVTLKLAAPSAAKSITYLDSKQWSQSTLLRGENGIAALTFCEVPLGPPPASPPSR